MGSSWDSKFFKGVIIFSGGENYFIDHSKNTLEDSDTVGDEAFIESSIDYCEAGDVFDTFLSEEFRLFEGEIKLKQYDWKVDF